MQKHTLSKFTGVMAMSLLALTACGSDDAVDEPQPTPSQPSSAETVKPPGSHTERRQELLDGLPASDDEESTEQDEETEEPEDPRANPVENPEDQTDRAGAREAVERAEQYVADQDSSLTDQYALPTELDELNALDVDWWTERDREVGEAVVTEMLNFDPATDFNRDEAAMRANYLIADNAQITQMSEYPALDDSWHSAVACNAEVETYVEHREIIEDHAHVAHFEVSGEYRWVNGDDDCELIQPEYFQVFELSLGDDGKITRVTSYIEDTAIRDRPSGWSM